jgi:hypothetical protein
MTRIQLACLTVIAALVFMAIRPVPAHAFIPTGCTNGYVYNLPCPQRQAFPVAPQKKTTIIRPKRDRR